MSVDAFLKIKEIKGESRVNGHEDEIQLQSWSWGMTQHGMVHVGSGGGAGKVDVQDLAISKYSDAATKAIIDAVCKGTHFAEATLTLRKAGGENPLDYMKITLSDVLITSYSVGGGGDTPVESAQLMFSKFKFAYQKQDKAGAKDGGELEFEYDIAANA